MKKLTPNKHSAQKRLGIAAKKMKMKRLTIDVSEELHTAIKIKCTQNRMKMSDSIRHILTNAFYNNER